LPAHPGHRASHGVHALDVPPLHTPLRARRCPLTRPLRQRAPRAVDVPAPSPLDPPARVGEAKTSRLNVRERSGGRGGSSRGTRWGRR
jgi:hypothetical protein